LTFASAVVAAIVVFEERLEKPAPTVVAAGIVALAMAAMLMMRIIVIRTNRIRNLPDDARPSNAAENTHGNSTDTRNHFHLPPRFLLLPLLRQTFGAACKRFATLQAIGVSMR
jgi:hypothetical protein